METNIFGGK